MRILAAITMLCIAVLCACTTGHSEYSGWENIPVQGWLYTDTLELTPIDTTLHDNDSIVDGAINLGLRHTNDYPYSNIWLELTYHGDSTMLYRDTVNIRLADVYGRWIGSGFGASYQQEVTVTPQAHIDLTRRVNVRHIMRVDTLRGIEGIGVFVSRLR